MWFVSARSAAAASLRLLAVLMALCLVTVLGLAAFPAPPAHAAPGLSAGTVVFNASWQASLYSESCTDSPAPVGTQTCQSYRLIFTDPMPASLSPGQVLVSATSAKLPSGLLVKVQSATDSGGRTTVTAAAAKPTDAYTGDVSTAFPVTNPTAGAQAKAGPSATSVNGVHVVPDAQVPAAVRNTLTPSLQGTCPPQRTATSNGFYVSIDNFLIPVGHGFAIQVQGWAFFALTNTQVTFYQQPNAKQPGVQAEFDETHYTDYSLYLTPVVLNQKPGKPGERPTVGSIFTAQADKTIFTIPLPAEDVQVGPLPVVITPGIDINVGLEGSFITGLGVDVEGGIEGAGDTFLMHTDGSVSHTSTPGTLAACGDLAPSPGDGTVVQPTVGVKGIAYIQAALNAQVYKVVGIAAGPSLFIEAWLTATPNSDSSCAWPAFDLALYLGVEVSFEFTLLDQNFPFASLSPAGLTKMGDYSIDPCQSVQPPGPGPSPTPTGWVTGHAAHAGNDYPYEGLGLFERHEGTDPWNEFYGQCDSFAAWKVYENLAGSNAQHPPYRPDKYWTPSNASISPVFGSADPTRHPPSGKLTWPNATDWGRVAKQAGYRVDGLPSPGSIAYWTSGQFGHVAYVTDVYPNGTIRIENYNLRLNGEYSTLVMDTTGAWDTSFNYPAWHVAWPDGFVHIGDGSAGPPQTYPAATTYPQGTYGPGSPEFSLAGSAYPGSNHGWYTQTGHGLIGSEQWTNTNGTSTPDSTATWAPALSPSACYTISVFVPDNYADGVAHYTVTGTQTWVPMPVEQQSYTNAWVPLGVYQADTGGHLKLMVSDIGPAGFYVAADAAQFVPASCHGIGPVGTNVDPSSPASEFSLTGSGTNHGWTASQGHGLYGNELWTHTNGATQDSSATWRVQLNAGQCYAVAAFIPDTYANALADYTVLDANGPHDAKVDQSVWTNQFVGLGTYHADANGILSVTVSDLGQTGLYVAADTVQFLPTQDCGGGGAPGGSPGYPENTWGPGSPQFSTSNWWASQSGHGLIGREMWTHTNGSTASSQAVWSPHLVANGCYTISAYIPDNYANSTQAHYTVMDANSSGASVIVNQGTYTNAWALLGNFRAQPDGSLKVMLTDVGTTGYYVAADAMQYAPADSTVCQSAGGPVAGGGYPAGTYGPGSTQFSSTNFWATDPGHGLTGQMLWTHTNGTTANSTASWSPLLSPSRCYVVSAYIPDNYANNTQASYYIWANTTTPRSVFVNQATTTGWTTLGTFTTYSDGSILVEVTDQGPSTSTYTAADAMRFTAC